MSALEDYRNIIAPHCGPGFAFREICDPTNPRKALPPFAMMRAILPTLETANELRMRMRYRCDAEGWTFSGLRIKAAYRPRGGAPDSQHKHNRALDLDLMFRDWDPATLPAEQSEGIRRAWYEIAVAFWYEHGCRGGLGLYCRPSRTSGVRVHVDCRSGSAMWQINGTQTVHPPCAIKIAKRLGIA